MNILYRKIYKILQEKNLSYRQLSRLINEYDSAINEMIRGKRNFKKEVIKKLLPVLEVSKKELESWILASRYDKEIFEKAIAAKKNKTNPKASVLSQNIDKLLVQKKMTRNALGAKIKYDPAAVRKMIIDEISMSKTVIERIAPVLEVSENDIRSWIVADNYSFKKLEAALENLK